jgi:hypothetical protein
MDIWYVDCDDLSCAWTKKKDAVNYVKEEAKNCGWKLTLVQGFEKSETDYLIYYAKCKNKPNFIIKVLPTFLDEKPYF